MNHLRQAWAARSATHRFQHVYLPEDPHEAYDLLQGLAGGHLARLRVVGEADATPYDKERLHDLINNGGLSHHPSHGAAPSTGYMASYEIHSPDQAAVHDMSSLTPEHIATHRQAIGEHLSQPDSYQGGWLDRGENKVYLDASRHFHDEGKVRDFSLKNKQLAYYDLGKGHEYYLDPKRDELSHADPAEHQKKYSEITKKFGGSAPPEYESYRHLYEGGESKTAMLRYSVTQQSPASGLPYLIQVARGNQIIAHLGVRPDGSWHYLRAESGRTATQQSVEEIRDFVNAVVGSLFEGSYERPDYLNGRPIGPWLNNHVDEIDRRKRQQ